MQRRKALSLVGGSVTAALAGCLGGGGGGDDNNNNSTNNDDPGPVISGEFRAESTGGLVWFGEPEESVFREEGIGLPPSERVEEPIVVNTEVSDGTWEASSSDIEFPPLDVNIGSGLDLSPEVTVPEGFSGEYDEQAGRLTIDGELTVTIDTDSGELSLTFSLSATTGTSGDLEGSFEVDGDTVRVTVVDNESVVNDTFGDPFVDDFLNLPGEFEGDNWFELDLELENR